MNALRGWLMALASGAAHAQAIDPIFRDGFEPREPSLIFSTGPLATGAQSASGVAAPDGYQWSELALEGDSRNFFLALGASGSTRIAQYVSVPSGVNWTLTRLDFYAYVTDAISSPFTAGTLRIWDRIPSAPGATLLCGDTTTNLQLRSSDAKLYRITHSTFPTATVPTLNRRLWRNELSVPTGCAGAGFFLGGHTYWFDYNVPSGSANVPPVTIPGQRTLPRAMALTVGSSGVWSAPVDPGTPSNVRLTPVTVPIDLWGFAP
jgi:serine protease